MCVRGGGAMRKAACVEGPGSHPQQRSLAPTYTLPPPLKHRRQLPYTRDNHNPNPHYHNRNHHQAFTDAAKLAKHAVVHETEKRWRCPLCAKVRVGRCMRIGVLVCCVCCESGAAGTGGVLLGLLFAFACSVRRFA